VARPHLIFTSNYGGDTHELRHTPEAQAGAWVNSQDWEEYAPLCDLWTVSAVADTDFRLIGACRRGHDDMLKAIDSGWGGDQATANRILELSDLLPGAPFPDVLQSGYLSSTWLDDAGGLWLFGGAQPFAAVHQATTLPIPIGSNSTCSSALWRYDPATGDWAGLNYLNAAQHQHPGEPIDSKATAWPAGLCGATTWGLDRGRGGGSALALAVVGGWTRGPTYPTINAATDGGAVDVIFLRSGWQEVAGGASQTPAH
jgi:hypothetical protein